MSSSSIDFFDPAYEFDCPKYYDFAAGSPRQGPPADSWFGSDPDAIEIGADGVIDMSPHDTNKHISTAVGAAAATPIVEASVDNLHWTVEEDDKRASITQQLKQSCTTTTATKLSTTTTTTTTALDIDIPLEDDGDVHSIRKNIHFTNSPTHHAESMSVPSSPVSKPADTAPVSTRRGSMAVTPSASLSSRRVKRKSAEKAAPRDRTRSPPRRASCATVSSIYRSTPSQHKRLKQNHDAKPAAVATAAATAAAAPAALPAAPIAPANNVTKPAKLTVAKSPRFATNSRVGRLSSAMSAEAQELLAIESKRAQQRRLAAINARNAQLLVNSVGEVHPVRSTKVLTQPTGFQFRTEQRCHKEKKAATETRVPAKPRTGPGGITQAIPFSFETDKRIKSQQEKPQEFVSFVQATQQFLKHDSHRRDSHSHSSAGDLAIARPLTQPRAPKLRTQQRERRSVLQTTEEQELARVQAIPKFKARPINEKIFASAAGDLGVPRIPKAKPTQFAEFHLVTPFRARSDPDIKPTEEAQAEEAAKYQFKAQPFKKEVFQGSEYSVDPREVVRSRAQSSHGLTVPKTPQLLTKKRKSVSPKDDHDDNMEPEFVFRARPMPVFEPLIHPEPAKKQKIQVQPFHLATEQRGKQKEELFEQSIAEEQAALKQQAQFHARPMIVVEPQVPVLPHRTIHASPFALRSVELAEESKQKLQAKLQLEREQELAAFSSFRATQPTVLTQPPNLLIKKSQLPLTEISAFHLPSSERAAHRESYEADRARQERQREMELAELAREKQEREQREIAEYRASLVHKPQPIAKPVEKLFQQVKQPRKPFSQRQSTSHNNNANSHTNAITKHSQLRISVDQTTMELDIQFTPTSLQQENTRMVM